MDPRTYPRPRLVVVPVNGEGRVLTGGTLLLRPLPTGCAWVLLPSPEPACHEAAVYRLTDSATGMTSHACVLHTAQMRALHPDWISEVRHA